MLPRDGTADDVRWCEVEPCYVFHPLNAYDLPDGRVVLDVVRHPRMFATDVNGPFEGRPTLDRWTLDPVAGKVLEERLDDRGQEFPRVDERLRRPAAPLRLRRRPSTTRPARPHGDCSSTTSTRGTTRSTTSAPAERRGEPVFVPAPATPPRTTAG